MLPGRPGAAVGLIQVQILPEGESCPADPSHGVRQAGGVVDQERAVTVGRPGVGHRVDRPPGGVQVVHLVGRKGRRESGRGRQPELGLHHRAHHQAEPRFRGQARQFQARVQPAALRQLDVDDVATPGIDRPLQVVDREHRLVQHDRHRDTLAQLGVPGEVPRRQRLLEELQAYPAASHASTAAVAVARSQAWFASTRTGFVAVRWISITRSTSDGSSPTLIFTWSNVDAAGPAGSQAAPCAATVTSVPPRRRDRRGTVPAGRLLRGPAGPARRSRSLPVLRRWPPRRSARSRCTSAAGASIGSLPSSRSASGPARTPRCSPATPR